MATDERTRRETYAHAVYGIVSFAVVLVASEGATKSRDLVALLAGYGVALWLTHAYAAVVASGGATTWREAIDDEWIIALAAIPAVLVAIIGTALDWNDVTTTVIALVACLVELITLQAAILAAADTTRAQLVTTVVVDAIVGGLVVAFQLIVKH